MKNVATGENLEEEENLEQGDGGKKQQEIEERECVIDTHNCCHI